MAAGPLTNDDDRPAVHASKRVCLGMIATAHGVRGLVKIVCYADDPALLDGVLHDALEGGNMLTVRMKNAMGKYWLAEIQGIADRDAAMALRGIKLWAGRDALPAPADTDEFYIEDLIGLTARHPDGRPAGTVTGADNFGAGDLLEITPPRGPAYYLPFTHDNVPVVDTASGHIVIQPPPGLSNESKDA